MGAYSMNDAGRIGFVIKGDYSATETYDFLDVVYYNGSSYVAKKLTTGNTPQASDDYWQVLANANSADISDETPIFTESTTRTNINSGEKISTLFGKIKKWFTDLKAVAFSGSYNDLSDKPSIPAAVAVKGNAESSYRTGNVNLTPANIGAVSTTGDTANNTVAFTSADSTTATAWTDVAALTTGEKHSSIFNKVSTMFKNIRFLYKMLGTTDISAIGDGSVTGALSTLNSNFQNVSGAADNWQDSVITMFSKLKSGQACISAYDRGGTNITMIGFKLTETRGNFLVFTARLSTDAYSVRFDTSTSFYYCHLTSTGSDVKYPS